MKILSLLTGSLAKELFKFFRIQVSYFFGDIIFISKFVKYGFQIQKSSCHKKTLLIFLPFNRSLRKMYKKIDKSFPNDKKKDYLIDDGAFLINGIFTPHYNYYALIQQLL